MLSASHPNLIDAGSFAGLGHVFTYAYSYTIKTFHPAGLCDDDIAACFCTGKYGRIPAPEGSPPGTPPVRRGRPMILEACMPMYGESCVASGHARPW